MPHAQVFGLLLYDAAAREPSEQCVTNCALHAKQETAQSAQLVHHRHNHSQSSRQSHRAAHRHTVQLQLSMVSGQSGLLRVRLRHVLHWLCEHFSHDGRLIRTPLHHLLSNEHQAN